MRSVRLPCCSMRVLYSSRVCVLRLLFFFFNDTPTTEIYTLSLHDALPISPTTPARPARSPPTHAARPSRAATRSEEHTSELQSRQYLVCRLLLEKKKKTENKNK